MTCCVGCNENHRHALMLYDDLIKTNTNET